MLYEFRTEWALVPNPGAQANDPVGSPLSFER